MDPNQIREKLLFEANVLLASFGKTISMSDLKDSNHNGFYVEIAPFEDSAHVELWYDYCSCHVAPLFWCGLSFVRRKDLHTFSKRLAARDKEILTIDEEIASPLPSDHRPTPY